MLLVALASGWLGAPAQFEHRQTSLMSGANFNAQSGELNAGTGYLPAMTLLRWARGMAMPEGGYPEPASDEEAMMQAGNGVQGFGGVRGYRGKSLRRYYTINQKDLMADRVIPSPFWLGGLSNKKKTD